MLCVFLRVVIGLSNLKLLSQRQKGIDLGIWGARMSVNQISFEPAVQEIPAGHIKFEV